MATQQIDKTSWPIFFDELSRQFEGAQASIEMLDADVGDQRTATLPFQGISFDTKGSGADTVTIMLGTEADDHLERVIAAPQVVFLKPAGEAGPAVLEIKAESGTTTLLYLEPVIALPTP